MAPSPNGSNGRDSAGQFTPGNAGGPENPYAQRVGMLRSALLDAVTEDDVRAVVKALVKKAKAGSVSASKILLDRYLGSPIAADILERIEALEKKED